MSRLRISTETAKALAAIPGSVILLIGVALFFGNITGGMPTLPYAGGITMAIGAWLLGALTKEAGKTRGAGEEAPLKGTRFSQTIEPPVSEKTGSPSVIPMPPRCVRCGGLLAESSQMHWTCSKCHATIARVGLAWELRDERDVTAPPTAVHCRQCGKQARIGSIFCVRCGARVA